jgi:hypothetical protein
MLQTTIDALKETISKSLGDFVTKQAATEETHRAEISRLNELLQKQVMDAQHEKSETEKDTLLETLISHSKKYGDSLNEIRGLNHTPKLDSIKQTFEANKTYLTDLDSNIQKRQYSTHREFPF